MKQLDRLEKIKKQEERACKDFLENHRKGDKNAVENLVSSLLSARGSWSAESLERAKKAKQKETRAENKRAKKAARKEAKEREAKRRWERPRLMRLKMMQLHQEIETFIMMTGKRPVVRSQMALGQSRNWRTWDTWLRNQGSSLLKYMDENFPNKENEELHLSFLDSLKAIAPLSGGLVETNTFGCDM